jgi:hypothetical protein
MCLSISGALNWSIRETNKNIGKNGWIKKDDGSLFTYYEFRNYLMDELTKGHEVLPIGDCDNFDYKTGCMGHGVPEHIINTKERINNE